MQKSLTENHRQLLAFIFCTSGCTIRQIAQGTNHNQEHCALHLKELQSSLYVKSVSYLQDISPFYYLTKKGFIACGIEQPKQRKPVFREIIRSYMGTELYLHYLQQGHQIISKHQMTKQDYTLNQTDDNFSIHSSPDYVVDHTNHQSAFSIDVFWEDLTIQQQKKLLNARRIIPGLHRLHFYVNEYTAPSLWALVPDYLPSIKVLVFVITPKLSSCDESLHTGSAIEYQECERGYNSFFDYMRFNFEDIHYDFPDHLDVTDITGIPADAKVKQED